MANKKLDDCYFYYYSTCYKGDDCAFRHEENALGCETVCNSWKAGNCQNVRCQYRHMLLKKNRKAIPCFWESQPNGCRKPHCPFLHKKGKPDGISQDSPNVSAGMNQTSGVSMMPKSIPVDSSLMSHEGLRRPNSSTLENDLNFSSPPVDPLVVKFEEESDNELDIPSPCKSVAVQSQKKSWVKTLEEIRLEKIQKLSAAFYSFTEGIEAENPNQESEDVMMDVLNNAIVKDLGVLTKTTNRSLVKSTVKRKASEDSDSLGFRVLTLAEIRQKRQKKNQDQEPDSTSESERLGEDKTPSAFNDDIPIQESSSQITILSPSNISETSVESSAVFDAPGRQKLINIEAPLQSSVTTGYYVDVSGKNPIDIRSPAMGDVDVPQGKKIKSPQKLPQDNVIESTNFDVPQKVMTSEMSTSLQDLTKFSSLDVPQQSIKITPQKVHQCTEGRNVDVPQQPIKIRSSLKVHQCVEGKNVDVPHRMKEINVVSPLRQLKKGSDVNAHQLQKPINITSPLCQDLPPQNQQNVDVPSRDQQIIDVPPRNQQVVDVPPKKKPIRLKRSMRRDTQEEPDQGANSSKRSKTTEDEQASFSVNSTRSEEADQSNSNLSEITSNPGEMDTDDILNGIDELLGN